jgi:predicted CoA-binding protein
MTVASSEPAPVVPGDSELRSLLETARTIAVVGLSSKPDRHSYRVASYLQGAGYRIIPVNPNEAEVLGERAHAELGEVRGPIDIVDVFRRPEHTPAVARQTLEVGARALWLQLGIVNEESGRIARAGGLMVVMGACLMVEHERLLG